MATKSNVQNAVEKLANGQIDPDSTVAREILQEVAERVLKETAAQDESTNRCRATAA